MTAGNPTMSEDAAVGANDSFRWIAPCSGATGCDLYILSTDSFKI